MEKKKSNDVWNTKTILVGIVLIVILMLIYVAIVPIGEFGLKPIIQKGPQMKIPSAVCTPYPGDNNYYVDGNNYCGNGCSDSWPGSFEQPWCTFARAISQANAGKHILIWPGEYYEGNIILQQDGYETALSGTLRCTHGSAQITGIGTQFLNEIEIGDFVRCDQMPTENTMGHRPGAFFPWSEVLSIDSGTSLTLAEPYRGESDNDGSGNDYVGKFITIQGYGDNPDDVKIIGRANEFNLGLTYQRYTGAPFDCDEEVSGVQDCTNVYYFDLNEYDHVGGIGTGKYGALFQRDTSYTRYPFDMEVHDKAYFHGSLDPLLSMNRESYRDCGCNDPGATGNNCDGESQCGGDWNVCASTAIPRVNKVPGTFWVDRNRIPDRWYFHMRNGQTPVQQHDLIEIANKGKVLDLKGADYVVLRRLAIWASAEEARENYGGFRFETGAGSDVSDWVLIDDFRHYGGRAKLATSGGESGHQHIVIEDSIFRGGSDFLGIWKASAFINSEVSGGGHYNWDMKPGNPTATSWEEGVILDRMFIHHALSYYWDARCAQGSESRFDWQTGRWLLVHGDHTWQGKFCRDDINEPYPDYFWVQNSVIGKGSDPIQIGAYPPIPSCLFDSSAPHFKWIYNTMYPHDGNDGEQGLPHAVYGGGTALATTETAHQDFLHFGSVYMYKDTLDQNDHNLYIKTEDYLNNNGAFRSDYNAYFNNLGNNRHYLWGIDNWDDPNVIKRWGPLEECPDPANLRCQDNNGDGIGDFEQHGVAIGFPNTQAYWTGFLEDIEFGDNILDFTPRDGSVLIDKIPAGQYYCPDHDFYGNPRNDGLCDIGAVERQNAIEEPPGGGKDLPYEQYIDETGI